MANSVPRWWMCGNCCPPRQEPPEPEQKAASPLPQELASLTEHLRHPDGETLLLLALLWLLWQEKADRKLLLALAYIVI